MYDKASLLEKLVQIDAAIVKIHRRFTLIKTADDFLDSDQGMEIFGICQEHLGLLDETVKQMMRPLTQ